MSRSFGLLATPNSNRERQQLLHGVPRDEEFKRIDALPRRTWTKHQIQRLQLKLTAKYKTKNGQRVLWADQAIALQEIEWYGGIAGGIRVSGGKTSIAFLAGSALPDLPRPLIICPSKSIKTGKVAHCYDDERKHWKVRDDYGWVAYEHIQRPDHVDYLNNYRPGIIILDEGHWAGRYNSGRTNRIGSYLIANPTVPCIVLTGSLIASRVLDDSLTLCYWARRLHSPLPQPTAKQSQRYWKLALDVPQRVEPGALRRWCATGESTVRGVGRRYYETPGIVCSAGKNVIGTSLTCTATGLPLRSVPILDAYQHVRNGRLPDGRELIDADGKNTWVVCQTLALGFYYVYDPEPPADWLDAYRNWAAYCREHIKSTDCNCDTERRVKDHIISTGDECWPLEEWTLVKHKYKFSRRAVWLSKDTVRAAQRWMDRNKNGLVWTQFNAFGKVLAASSGRPFYHTNARDKRTRRFITEHSANGGPAIASIRTCSEDLNLQKIFNANLFPAPPATGAFVEQAVARTHRYGCAWPEVSAEFWIACAENKKNLSVARLRERQAAAMTGDYSRKLLIADWTEYKHPKKVTGPQWTTTKIARALLT